MIWFLMSVFAALIWAVVNFVDKFIVEKISENKGVGALVLFSGLAGIPVVIITFFFLPKEILSMDLSVSLWVLLAGVFYLLYVLGYLYALSNGDVSSIVPQLLLAPIISIFLGYLFLGEKLNPWQWIGAGLIISGAITLSANLKNLTGMMKMKVMGFIVGASFFLSLNAIIFKYAVAEESISFWATIFWEHVGFILFALICYVFIKSYRRDFLIMIRTKGSKVISANVLSELFTLIGNTAAHYATILAPVALVQITADGIQPFFILGIGAILTRFFPNILVENDDLKSFTTKLVATTFMVVGIFFVNK